jgi:hypothetical protein
VIASEATQSSLSAHWIASSLRFSIPYVDPEGRIDAQSVADQVAWYKSQSLLKGEVDVQQLIDSRYALIK